MDKPKKNTPDNGHRFQPGNPGGRLQLLGNKAEALALPATVETARDVATLARRYTKKALRTLASILADPHEKGATRVRAAEVLIARGWGSPDKAIDPLAGLSEAEVQEAARQILKGRVAAAELPQHVTVVSDKTVVANAEVFTADNGQKEEK